METVFGSHLKLSNEIDDLMQLNFTFLSTLFYHDMSVSCFYPIRKGPIAKYNLYPNQWQFFEKEIVRRNNKRGHKLRNRH